MSAAVALSMILGSKARRDALGDLRIAETGRPHHDDFDVGYIIASRSAEMPTCRALAPGIAIQTTLTAGS